MEDSIEKNKENESAGVISFAPYPFLFRLVIDRRTDRLEDRQTEGQTERRTQ